MEETCSLKHDMVEYVSSCWEWGKLLGEQDSNGDMDGY